MEFLGEFVRYSHQLAEGPFVLAVIALGIFALVNYVMLSGDEKWYYYLGAFVLDLVFALFMGIGLLWWIGLLCLVGGFIYHKIWPQLPGGHPVVGILMIIFCAAAGIFVAVFITSFLGPLAIIKLKMSGRVLFGVLAGVFAIGGVVTIFLSSRRSASSTSTS